MIKAKVIQGRYQGEEVRISNVSSDELGIKNAACLFKDGRRANLPVTDLQLIKEEPEAPRPRSAKTSSMPFVSGASSSRTLTQTKNMGRLKPSLQRPLPETYTGRICDNCGQEYNLEARKNRSGKITECEDCASEVVEKVEGKMVFSHKTGATIEITKDGELIHEAQTFDPKNKN
jgi:hypothetical protein